MQNPLSSPVARGRTCQTVFPQFPGRWDPLISGGSIPLRLVTFSVEKGRKRSRINLGQLSEFSQQPGSSSSMLSAALTYFCGPKSGERWLPFRRGRRSRRCCCLLGSRLECCGTPAFHNRTSGRRRVAPSSAARVACNTLRREHGLQPQRRSHLCERFYRASVRFLLCVPAR